MQRVEFILKKKSKNRKYKPKEYEGKTNIIDLKEFEQYSIIEINEDVSEVIDYLDRLQKESEVETLMFYLPLDEFCIKCNEILIDETGDIRDCVDYFVVKQYKSKWNVKAYVNDKNFQSTKAINTLIFTVTPIPEQKDYKVKILKSGFGSRPDLNKRISEMFIWLLGYICYVKDHPTVNYEKQEIVKDSKKNTTNKTKATSDKLNKNNKDYKITLGDKSVMLHLKPNEIRTFKRKYVRMIESWSVMGHVRHYRNGKTVFIKPYVKGKARNKQDEITKRNYVVKRNKK